MFLANEPYRRTSCLGESESLEHDWENSGLESFVQREHILNFISRNYCSVAAIYKHL